MKKQAHHNTAGYLFLASGALFVLAGWLGEQPAFGGVAMMFIILGIVYIKKAKESSEDQGE